MWEFEFLEWFTEWKASFKRRNAWFVMLWQYCRGHAVGSIVLSVLIAVWCIAAVFASWADRLLIPALMTAVYLMIYDIVKKQWRLLILSAVSAGIIIASGLVLCRMPQLRPPTFSRDRVIPAALVLLSSSIAMRFMHPNHVILRGGGTQENEQAQDRNDEQALQ